MGRTNAPTRSLRPGQLVGSLSSGSLLLLLRRLRPTDRTSVGRSLPRIATDPADDSFGERLSENSRGPTTSCTSMTRSRFCAGPFRSRDLRFGRLPRSWEVPPKRRCHFRTTARNSPTASRPSDRPLRAGSALRRTIAIAQEHASALTGADDRVQRIALVRNPHVVGAARTPSRALASRAKHAPVLSAPGASTRGKASAGAGTRRGPSASGNAVRQLIPGRSAVAPSAANQPSRPQRRRPLPSRDSATP